MNTLRIEQSFQQQQEALLSGLRDKAALLAHAKPLALSSLDPADTLIISVDINNGFAVRGALCSAEAGAMLAPTVALLTRAKAAGFATLAFCDRHTPESPELCTFPPHCVVGTGEDELPAALAQVADQILYKNSTNGFFAPGAQVALAAYRCFVVTGCLTEFCIYQFATALRAWLNERGRTDCAVIVPLNLIDSYDAPGHSALLYNLVYATGMAENGVQLASSLE